MFSLWKDARITATERRRARTLLSTQETARIRHPSDHQSLPSRHFHLDKGRPIIIIIIIIIIITQNIASPVNPPPAMTQQPQLQPVPRPWGVFDQFIARNTETLILKERVFSLTGDSFDVRTANGQPVFKIQGRKMTISGRKSVSDMQGNHLFDIVQELMHIHTTYVAEDPKGNRILTVRNSIRRNYHDFDLLTVYIPRC